MGPHDERGRKRSGPNANRSRWGPISFGLVRRSARSREQTIDRSDLLFLLLVLVLIIVEIILIVVVVILVVEVELLVVEVDVVEIVDLLEIVVEIVLVLEVVILDDVVVTLVDRADDLVELHGKIHD